MSSSRPSSTSHQNESNSKLVNFLGHLGAHWLPRLNTQVRNPNQTQAKKTWAGDKAVATSKQDQEGVQGGEGGGAPAGRGSSRNSGTSCGGGYVNGLQSPLTKLEPQWEFSPSGSLFANRRGCDDLPEYQVKSKNQCSDRSTYIKATNSGNVKVIIF